VEPEETAVAREGPINTFPWKRTRDATTGELLEHVFSVESVPTLRKETVTVNDCARVIIGPPCSWGI
jgi:hypothetical protein